MASSKYKAMITAISIVDPELAGLNCLSWWKGLLQNLLDTTAKGQLHSSLCLWAKKLNLTSLAGILMCKVTILQFPHTIHCDCPFCRLYYCMFFFHNSSSQRILLETVSENLQQSSCFHKLCYQQPSITAVAITITIHLHLLLWKACQERQGVVTYKSSLEACSQDQAFWSAKIILDLLIIPFQSSWSFSLQGFTK